MILTVEVQKLCIVGIWDMTALHSSLFIFCLVGHGRIGSALSNIRTQAESMEMRI
jgi:hypothetical protein